MHAIPTLTLLASLATGILAQSFGEFLTFTNENCAGDGDIVEVTDPDMKGTLPNEVLSIQPFVPDCLRKFPPACHR